MKNNADKFFSKIVTATTEIEIPESPLDSTGSPDKTFPYRFYKKHFCKITIFQFQNLSKLMTLKKSKKD